LIGNKKQEINWGQRNTFLVEIDIDLEENLEKWKKNKTQRNVYAMGVEGGLVRNKGYVCLIALCYQIANSQKSEDKNNNGWVRYD